VSIVAPGPETGSYGLVRGEAASASRPGGGRVRGEASSVSPTRHRIAPGISRAVALIVLAVAATGCSRTEMARLGMPEPASEQAERILTLWQGSWIAAFAVGIVVWGLIIWAIIFHRKRSDALPPQVRYNLPIEILYTVVPFIMIAVLFYFTARDQNYLQAKSANPQVVVNVTGFQWSWQFDYPTYRRTNGSPVSVVGQSGGKPVMVVPTGRTVRFNLNSPDVIHSFWVPSLLYKMDVIPGHPNAFEVKLTRAGLYEGRCAELCGVDHSRMLFQLKAVSPEEFPSNPEELQRFLDSQQPAGVSQ
jgi:cytochrome c oxidase subunit 2